MGTTEDQERRILESTMSLLASRIQGKLPTGKRGIRARDPIRERLPRALEEALDALVSRVAREVSIEVEFLEEVRPKAIDGRLEVLTNALPCDRCGKVRSVAVVVLQAGQVVEIECEACAPEFEGRRKT